MKARDHRNRNKINMQQKLTTQAKHFVSNAAVPYKTDRGIHFSDQCEANVRDMASDPMIDWIVGSGYLFEEKEFPFKTFCSDDVSALRSDWDVSGGDLASAVRHVISSRGERFGREFYAGLIKLLRKHVQQDEQLLLPLGRDMNNAGQPEDNSRN